jgi:dephospho-CoA kinase
VTKPFVVGITGGIATGKSAVMDVLGRHGFETIDADQVYHDMIRPGGQLVEPLVEAFGPTILADDGSIDRRALGAVVFSDVAKMKDLDRLTHPVIIAAVRNRIERSDNERIAVDAVKLLESGMASLCDQVWLVVSNAETQRQRLIARNGLTVAEADERLASQPDEKQRRAIADVVIDNSGTRSHLEEAVSITLQKLLPKG